MKGDPRPEGELIVNVECLAAIYAVGALDSRRLPKLATWLLSRGLETETIVALAGLDLQPFFPVDAAELFEQVLAEFSLTATHEDQLRLALGAVSGVFLDERLPTEFLLKLGERLAIENDYPSEPPGVMDLYTLEDEWYGGYNRERTVLAEEAHRVAQQLLEGSPEVSKADPEFLALACGIPNPAPGP